MKAYNSPTEAVENPDFKLNKKHTAMGHFGT